MFSFLSVKSELRLSCLNAIEVGHLWSVLLTPQHDASTAQNVSRRAHHYFSLYEARDIVSIKTVNTLSLHFSYVECQSVNCIEVLLFAVLLMILNC